MTRKMLFREYILCHDQNVYIDFFCFHYDFSAEIYFFREALTIAVYRVSLSFKIHYLTGQQNMRRMNFAQTSHRCRHPAPREMHRI